MCYSSSSTSVGVCVKYSSICCHWYYFLSDHQSKCREMHIYLFTWQSLNCCGWMEGGQVLRTCRILVTALLPTAGPEVFSLSPFDAHPKIFVCVCFFTDKSEYVKDTHNCRLAEKKKSNKCWLVYVFYSCVLVYFRYSRVRQYLVYW